MARGQSAATYGLVVYFTLKPGTGPAFDALAGDALAAIHAAEPGTLVYACHTVHGNPDARVFYELYRDRAAFEEHESSDHVRRFLAERERYLAGPPRVERLALQTGKGVPARGLPV